MRKTYASLDGIRGMAVLIVIASHMSNPYEFWFSGSGKIGVWLFFILSSFLLSSYFIARPEKSLQPIEWMNYAVRRFMRIYPIYFIVLLFDRAVNVGEVNPGNWLNHILLRDGAGHYWTMPVEMTFYLVLPIVVFVIIFGMKSNMLATVTAFTILIGIHQYFYPYQQTAINDFHLMPYLPVFLIGCATALVNEKINGKTFSGSHKVTFDILAVVILIGSFITMPKIWGELFHPVANDYFHRGYIFYGLAWSVFIIFMLHGSGIVRKVFEWKGIRVIGGLSYSAYLIHPFILEYTFKHFPVNVWTVLLMLLTIFVISWVLHISIERPCMRINLLRLKRTKQITSLNTGH